MYTKNKPTRTFPNHTSHENKIFDSRRTRQEILAPTHFITTTVYQQGKKKNTVPLFVSSCYVAGPFAEDCISSFDSERVNDEVWLGKAENKP